MLDDHDGLSYLDNQGCRIACQTVTGTGPGLFFLTGFGSDMMGAKASHLAGLARLHGIGFTRFDYSGHGKSGGAFRDGTLQSWLADALAVFDQVTTGRQIVIGSSMGGWLALHLARARPGRIHALVGIAAAPDFTEDMIWNHLSAIQKLELENSGSIELPSEYGAAQIITHNLIESGRALLVLRDRFALDCPVRLIHGMNDRDVPFSTSLRLAEALTSADVQITLIKDGDHRLSRDGDLALLSDIVLKVAR